MYGRLTADGLRDDSFGEKVRRLASAGTDRQIAIDSLGLIVVLGLPDRGLSAELPDGSLDPSFGTVGTIADPSITTREKRKTGATIHQTTASCEMSSAVLTFVDGQRP